MSAPVDPPPPPDLRRHFLGAPSLREPDHYDWLFNRPGECALTCNDDIRFDVAGRQRVADLLI